MHKIDEIKRIEFGENKGKLPALTMPGLYPIIYVTPDNDTLCADCATEALDDEEGWEDWKPSHFFIYYEGYALECAECGKQIESAYGDPEED